MEVIMLSNIILQLDVPRKALNLYRLYHEVEISTWFTHWGPEARGCVNHVETDTEWYNQLVPWAMCPWQCIDDLATIASAKKGLSAYLATVQTIIAIDWTRPARMIVAADTFFVQLWFLLVIQNHDTITTVCNTLTTVSIPTWTRLLQLQLHLWIADLAKTVNRSAQTINVRPAH